MTSAWGIYAHEPSVLEHLPDGHCQFPDLVTRLLAAGQTAAAYRNDAPGSTSACSQSTSAQFATRKKTQRHSRRQHIGGSSGFPARDEHVVGVATAGEWEWLQAVCLRFDQTWQRP